MSNSSAGDPIKFVPKPWGYEKWLANSDKYCGKLLFLCKGKKTSWHFHKLKDEVFYIHKGSVVVYYGRGDDLDEAFSLTLTAGDKFHVPIGLRHRVYALEDTEVFEFSTQHFDSDSHRIIQGD